MENTKSEELRPESRREDIVPGVRGKYFESYQKGHFQDCKMVNLEVRPVYVRKEESTRGHVFVVMLAYMIIR